MRSEDIVISVRNLTKTYRVFGHPGDRVKQAVTFGLRKYYSGFTALSEVSFDVKRGETIGIIGRNGSGKSTLLQLICGILKPTSGSVQVNGRISALLELGAGFNPEFTGRENVYFQGALMGLAKDEMDLRYEDIIAFADIGDFIDQPVRTYSSGMFVRLAFATGIHVSPDILVNDEALAVGDEAFQRKCFRRMQTFKNNGGTVLFVSHNTNMIATYCDRVLLLDQGQSLRFAEPGEVIEDYRRLSTSAVSRYAHDNRKESGGRSAATAEASLEELYFSDLSGAQETVLVCGRQYHLNCRARFEVAATDIRATAFIRLRNGYILGTASSVFGMPHVAAGKSDIVDLQMNFTCILLPGYYILDCVIEGDCGDGNKVLGQLADVLFEVESDLPLLGVGAINFSVSPRT